MHEIQIKHLHVAGVSPKNLQNDVIIIHNDISVHLQGFYNILYTV
jgi:hypothetical protein